ncbi:hypothetical protein AGMMS50256_33950 [Betaproteobacteria bacterium]|nr:hypothetical protein AGMMS50256_33950 [Betaproteobacteria bacterium]
MIRTLLRLLIDMRIAVAEMELVETWAIHAETPAEQARLIELREARAKKLLSLRQKRHSLTGQVKTYRIA